MSATPAVDPWSLTVMGETFPGGVEEHFLEVAGVRFRYLTGGSKGGPPLILLHGWPTWAEVWLPSARILGEQRSWIAPDLPCQGRSSLLPRGSRTIPSYRAAVASFLDALNLSRYVVVGNSMGGTLAVMAALDRPERVERLVVVDGAGLTPRLPSRTARIYLPFLLPCFFRAPGPASVRKLLTRAVFHDPRRADLEWVNTMVSGWAPQERRRALMDTGFGLRRPDASVAGDLGRVRVPTLVISGRQDVQFPWQSAREAASRIPGARFEAVEDAGHFPMVERPAEVARLISEFLSGRPSTDANAAAESP